MLRAPCPVASASCSVQCSFTFRCRRTSARASETLWLCPSSVWWPAPLFSPLLSFLRPLHARPLLSPSPRAPVAKQLQVEAPDAGGAFAVALDGLFSGVSICFSLSTHTARAASCHFSASARSAAHTIRYNCMMSPGILLLQRAASTRDTIQFHDVTWYSPPATRGFIWDYPAPI